MGVLDDNTIDYIVEKVKELQYPSVRKLAGDLLRKISLENYTYSENKVDRLQIKADNYLCSFRFEKELDLFIENIIKNKVKIEGQEPDADDSENKKICDEGIKNINVSFCKYINNYFKSKYFNEKYILPICDFINSKKGQTDITKDILYAIAWQYYENSIKQQVLNEFLKESFLRKECVKNMPEQCRRDIINWYCTFNIFAKYNDNIVLLDSKNGRYIANDNRKIFPIILKEFGLFNKIEQFDESIMIYILNNYIYDNIKVAAKPYIVENVKNVKIGVFYKLYEYEKNRLTNDEYFKFESKIKNLKALLKLNDKIKDDTKLIFDIKSEEIFDIRNHIRLIKIMYDICDGIKENFDQIAELLAIVFMGQDLLEKYKVKYKNFTVVCTNNKKLVEDFFRSLFILDKNKHENGYNHKEFYKLVMHDACEDIFKNVNDYGVTDYSISGLCSSENISKFLDDQLAGMIVNISSDTKGLDKNDGKKFEQLLKLNSCSEISTNHKYLGNQFYVSDKHYIFITNDDSRFSELKDLKYQCINLSQKLPADATVFHSKMQLNQYERAFMLTNVVKYGIDLILNKNIDETADNIPKLNYVEVFIKECCLSVEYDVKDGLTAENATALKTLEGAYSEFYKLAKGSVPSSNVINNYIRDNLNLDRITRKSSVIVDRDISLGYEQYVLTKTGGGTHVFGLLLKSLEEIKQIAEEYGSNRKLAEHQMNLEEFIKFFAGMGDFNSIEISELYSELNTSQSIANAERVFSL